MNRKPSHSFISEVTERILSLKRVSDETGINITDDLIKALGQLSEINNSEDALSDTSEDISESILIQQPTNSILSISSINSQMSLITTIKNKNNELEKSCTKKLSELRSTTSEFCTKNQILSKKNSIEAEEIKPKILEKTETKRNMSKTVYTQGSSTSNISDYTLENILEQLTSLKSELTQASYRIYESNKEIIKQKDENEHLKAQIETMIIEYPKTQGISCGCRII